MQTFHKGVRQRIVIIPTLKMLVMMLSNRLVAVKTRCYFATDNDLVYADVLVAQHNNQRETTC